MCTESEYQRQNTLAELTKQMDKIRIIDEVKLEYVEGAVKQAGSLRLVGFNLCSVVTDAKVQDFLLELRFIQRLKLVKIFLLITEWELL